MAPTDRSRRTHDTLFPNHVSTLAATDPELIDVFDNFAFDEVLEGSSVSPKPRKSRSANESAARQAIPRSALMPSKYPINSSSFSRR
jgi:4-carboxymuconolactone decarboxylase